MGWFSIFTTDKGVALWADCMDAVGCVDNGSVNLIFSSPPYPLNRKKAYGNLNGTAYLDWLVRIVEAWMPKLTSDGSIVLNLSDVYEQGKPFVDLYQERLLLRLHDDLGLRLCQRYQWHSPSKMPAAEWVTVRRVRVKQSLENIFWLSASEAPYADNRQVLQPYSASYREVLARKRERSPARPSGHAFREGGHLVNHGGSIPGNLIIATNSESTSAYMRACRNAGLPIHPARFPKQLPEFFIKLLTKPGDLVGDIFGGSAMTGEVAEGLGRYWFVCELMREYLMGGRFRFPQSMMAA